MMDRRYIISVIILVFGIVIITVLASGLPGRFYPGDYEVVEKEYVSDPFEVSLTGMDNLKSMPVDSSEDGMDWTRVSLPEPCVNGDNERTYIMVSKGSSENIFIYMQGGGAGTGYFTSRFMVRTLHPSFVQTSKSKEGIFNRKNDNNPFQNWTFVYIPYSTGDVHAGNRVIEYVHPFNSEKTRTVYHAGFVNATTVLRWVAEQNISFDNIVIGGSSAGGYGTVLNSYIAEKVFHKPLLVINDAGPGLASKVDPMYKLDRTIECWGWNQNLPQKYTDYIRKKGEPIYGIEKLLSKTDCTYALYEDQMDFVIGPLFLKYPGLNFKHILKNVTSELENSCPNSFYRFLEYGFGHTVLSDERFYNEKINGVHLYEWINDLLGGNPNSYVERWDFSLL